MPLILSAAAMFGALYFLTVVNVAKKSLIVYSYINGFWFTIITIILNLLISVLFGIYLSLLLFKRDLKNTGLKQSAHGLGGALVGVVAAGCPTCGVPFLAYFGAPLALTLLPLKGLEIKMISIALLVLSIHLFSKSITARCQLPKGENNGQESKRYEQKR